jgi:ArsR family transcriptional regulator
MNNSTYHVFFNNLSNPLRVDIISALKQKNLSVNELARILKVEQSKLSHALSNLRECNIVKVSIKGKNRIYSLNKETIIPILNIIDKHARSYCKGKCHFCMGCSK